MREVASGVKASKLSPLWSRSCSSLELAWGEKGREEGRNWTLHNEKQ